MAEEDLLIPIFAFECELIDLPQLLAACRAWSVNKSVSLGDQLLQRGWITEDDLTFLKKLVQRKLVKHGADARVTLNAVVSGEVHDALQSIADHQISGLLSSWPAGGPVLIESIGENRTDSTPPATRYSWLSEVGNGGLGRVWLARDNDLAREVALKEIKPESASRDAVRRLIKEAQITGQLQHPNIVPVYEVHRGERPFYTMKLVKGETLAAAIVRHHQAQQAGRVDPLSMPRLIGVFVNVCDAIAYAHSRGIVHRDLKPHNVVLGDYGEAIVLDWGLARQIGTEDEEAAPVSITEDAWTVATRIGATLGTPAYMAPEQAQGRIDLIDQRTDIYGLGAILFELLTGHAPHCRPVTSTPADSSVQICEATTYSTQIVDPLADLLRRIIAHDTPHVRDVCPGVSAELDAICARAMAKKRNDRYQSVRDLKTALLEFQIHEQSIELSSAAANDLSLARSSADYACFNRALYGYTEALRKWPENLPAAEGLRETQTAYSRAAFEKGDFDLAMSQLSPVDEGQRDLMTAIQLAVEQRESRQERIRQLRRLAMRRGKIAERERQKAVAAQIAAESAQRAEANRANELRVSLARSYLERGLAEYREGFLQESAANLRRGWALTSDEDVVAAAYLRVILDRLNQGNKLLLAPLMLADTVLGLAFSPDGTRIVSASGNELRLWDARTGAAIGEPMAHYGPVYCVEFSPDGRRLVAGSHDGTVVLWDGHTGAALETMLHSGPIRCVAFSPDGLRIVSGSRDCSLRMWNAATGTLISEQADLKGIVHCVAFSPDGQRIATGCADHSWQLLDSQLRILVNHRPEPDQQGLAGHFGAVHHLVFSPDGSEVATGSVDRAIRRWNAQTGSPLGKPMRHKAAIKCLAYSPDGTRLASGSDNWLLLWDPVTEVLINRMPHADSVLSVAFSSDGTRIVSGSHDKTVRLWDARTGARLGEPMKHTGPVNCVSFSPDTTSVVSGSEDRTVRLWDAYSAYTTGNPVQDWGTIDEVSFGHDGRVVISRSLDHTLRAWPLAGCGLPDAPLPCRPGTQYIAVSADGTRLVAKDDENCVLRLWDTRTGAILGAPMPHGSFIDSAAFSPDGIWLASRSNDNMLQLWNGRTGAAHGDPIPHQDRISCLAFSPQGNLVATGGENRELRVWELATGSSVGQPMIQPSWIVGLEFSPDGKRIGCICADDSLTVWDLHKGCAVIESCPHTRSIRGGIVNAGGNRVASIHGNSMTLWNADTGAQIGEPMVHAGLILCAGFSSQGDRLASGGQDGTLKLWEAETGESQGESMRHDGAVNCIAFSPDGGRIAAGSTDRTLRIWDCETRASLGDPLRHSDQLTCVAFSPNGKSVVTGCADKSLRLWDLSDIQLGEMSRQEVDEVVSLWSGLESVAGDKIRVLTETECENLHRKLAAKAPAMNCRLLQTGQEVAQRHEIQVTFAEKKQDWFAASFHIDRLGEIAPHDPRIAERRAGIVVATPQQLRSLAGLQSTELIYLCRNNRPGRTSFSDGTHSILQSTDSDWDRIQRSLDLWQIAVNPVDENRIAWSQIALNNTTEVYVGDRDKQVATNLRIGDSPVWTRDGQSLIYSCTDRDDAWFLAVYDGEKRNKIKIPWHHEGHIYPDPSPDGEWIAFSMAGADATLQIGLISMDGRTVRQLTHRGDFNTRAAYSPNGKYLAFTRGRPPEVRVILIEIETGHETVICNHALPWRPVWVADGRI